MVLHFDDWGVEEEQAHPRGKGGKFIKKGTVETSAPELSPADQKKKEKLESKIEQLKEMEKSDPDTFEGFGYGEELKKLEKQLKKLTGEGGKKKAEPKKSEPKKSEPKKTEPKKEEPKPEPKKEPKKEEPKKPEKKEEPKPEPKEEPKKEEPKEEPKPEPKKEEPETVEFDDAVEQKLKLFSGKNGDPICMVNLDGEFWRYTRFGTGKLYKCDESGRAIKDENGKTVVKPVSEFKGKQVKLGVALSKAKKKPEEKPEKKPADSPSGKPEKKKEKKEEKPFEVEEGKVNIGADMFEGYASKSSPGEKIEATDSAEKIHKKLPSGFGNLKLKEMLGAMSERERANWHKQLSGISFHKTTKSNCGGYYTPGTHDVHLKTSFDTDFATRSVFHETAHEAFDQMRFSHNGESDYGLLPIINDVVDPKELMAERDALLKKMGLGKYKKIRHSKDKEIDEFFKKTFPDIPDCDRYWIEREVKDFLDIISFDDRCQIGGHTEYNKKYYSDWWGGVNRRRYTELIAIYSEHKIGERAGHKASKLVMPALREFMPKTCELAEAMYKLIFER